MPISKKVRSQIENDLRNNRAINQIKKSYGVGSKTVYQVMDEAGIPRERREHSQTKNANIARKEYCSEKRISLIDAGMKKLEEMLPEIDKPSGMRDWFVALGTAIDKRRLEDPGKGEETESDEYLAAVRATAKDDWKEEASALQVGSSEQETAPGNELVDA